MSLVDLDSIIEDFQAMQSHWGAETTPGEMRTDLERFSERFLDDTEARVTRVSASGVPADLVTARGASEERTLLYFHGGGYSVGSARSHRTLAKRLSQSGDTRVLLPDYRLAPEHVFPAPVEDALAAYRWLLQEGCPAGKIALGGDSAGGGLALALLLALRESGEPLPACAVLLSPWADMECAGESYRTCAELDPIASFDMCRGMAQMYLGGAEERHPQASPVHASFEGFPPLLVQVGDREVVLDDARGVERQARAAGVPVQLDVWKGMIHQWHLYAAVLSEGRDAIEQLGCFVQEHWSGS